MKDQILMPKELTAENNAKAIFIGEFFEIVEYTCPECQGEMDAICEHCDDEGYIRKKVIVSWTTIKEIYKTAVKHFGKEYQIDNKSLNLT